MYTPVSHEPRPAGSAAEVFTAFLRLGLTSFGGPIAHLGYFRREFVTRRRWVSEARFAELVGLCQFLPGPASSELGFALGLLRAGAAGGLAAFVAFTAPSALLMLACAWLLPAPGGGAGAAVLHGLKLAALAVVADGVVGMARTLCPDLPRRLLAAAAAAVLLATGEPRLQVAVVALGGLAGLYACRAVRPLAAGHLPLRYGRRIGIALVAAYALLLAALPLAGQQWGGLAAVAAAFYRTGALVFGGGHVMLPLLRETVVAPGWMTADDFLAGYGAAQALPGPISTVAAYLGLRLPPGLGGPAGAATALVAIFLPGLLLVAGVLPLWHVLAARPVAARAVAGVNAAVVGLLAAALWDPLWVSTVTGPGDVAIAVAGFALLAAWRTSAVLVVAGCIAASVAVHGLSG